MIVVLCGTTIAQLPYYRSPAYRRCPVNQEWNDCGSACPPSCDKPVQRACIAICKIGCQCRQGFLLNSFGNCVHPSYCINK
ncbi:chymotrypsin inhibitor-like [Temnothorax longispinosus]|uniref:chymotrypsin inhibitor-like n=1 Tax=Temnothorax longispinosus TaxID=300112 RepID=UPI003A9A5A9D